MIAGIFHQGSGLGNQLHRYVMTRVLALDKGLDFGMLNPENFKGKDFLQLDMGKCSHPNNKRNYGDEWEEENGICWEEWCDCGERHLIFKTFNEKKILENGVDIRSYDPEINFVEDDIIIDGEFQDERYFGHRLPEIREWLKPKSLAGFYDKVCVINFRGGEYKVFPDLYLTKEYWDKAVEIMRQQGIDDSHFLVVTDDMEEARKFFPDFRITHSLADDWCSILMADYLILSNSSFAILPALLNQKASLILAPRYWARRNTKTWSLPQNYYKKFNYI